MGKGLLRQFHAGTVIYAAIFLNLGNYFTQWSQT